MKKKSGKKIKVLHIIASNSIAGAENVLLMLADNIDREKFEIIFGIFTADNNHTEPMWRAALNLQFQMEAIRARHLGGISSLYDIYKIFRKHRPNIIHGHGYKPNILGFLIAFIFRTPIVTTFHGWLHTKKYTTKIFFIINLILLRYFDKIIAVSREIEVRLLNHGIQKQIIKTIQNVPYFLEDKSSVEPRFNEKVAFPAYTRAIIGFIGRLENVKGCKYFIEAAANLLKLDKGYFFVVVGEGPEREHLENYVNKLGLRKNVTFCGFHGKIKEVFQTLDLFVLPSLSEGIPLALLESMATGTPVVASAVGGVPEVIQDRWNGYLVPPGDVQSLTNVINYAINNRIKTQKIADAAIRTIEEKFCIKDWIFKIENIYLECLKGFQKK